MDLKAYYESIPEVGSAVSDRVRISARMFGAAQQPVERLLDIGCGVGEIGRYLKEALGARELHGVEISENQVEAALRNGVRAVAIDAGAERLPFPDAYFDAVFCGEVIEHVVDTDQLLDEIGRVLTPSGVCVLTTPNLAGWYCRLALLLGFLPFPLTVSFRYGVGLPRFMGIRPGGGHIRVFTHGALLQLLKLHAFQILATSGVPILEQAPSGHLGAGAFAARLVDPFDRLLSRAPALSGHLVVAFRRQTPA